MSAVLHVCMTCRAGKPVPENEVCPGTQLYHALEAEPVPPGVTIRPVECLSACDHGCSIALTQVGGWSYVYGRMSEADVPEILRGAALFAASADGLVPWRDRPVIFRKQCLARIPPIMPALEI